MIDLPQAVPHTTGVSNGRRASIRTINLTRHYKVKPDKKKGEAAKTLVALGTATAQRAGTAMDAAAGTLARIHARYGLDLPEQMPGESTEAFGARYSGAQPSNILPPN